MFLNFSDIKTVGFSELRMQLPLTAEDAFWHASCNVEWVARTVPLQYDQHALRGSIYFISPNHRVVGAIHGIKV